MARQDYADLIQILSNRLTGHSARLDELTNRVRQLEREANIIPPTILCDVWQRSHGPAICSNTAEYRLMEKDGNIQYLCEAAFMREITRTQGISLREVRKL